MKPKKLFHFLILTSFLVLFFPNSAYGQEDKGIGEQIFEKGSEIVQKGAEQFEQGAEQAKKAGDETLSDQNGGCLIATATFGTELSPQVQQLREIRDNTLLQTQTGSAFIQGFNQFYYSFSPTIADWERQNQFFKESIKIGLTPLITSLLILNYVEIDSEENLLFYGIGIILLNVGMYFVGPIAACIKFRKLAFKKFTSTN